MAKYGIRDFSNWCANTLTIENGRPLRIEAFQRNERVDPDGEDMWDKGFRWEIPPCWRDLMQVPPPGNLPDWPYPRNALEQTSRWYRASPQ